MSVAGESTTAGRTRETFASEADLDEFVRVLGQFERGEITPDQWRAFRLVRGTYGQRQPDVQMLRVKIPQGIVTGEQMHALADVADKYSRGFGHITTRQNLQFHFIPLPQVEHAMRLLADAGLTTREACGNSVRNITACPYAGVAADEVFDVTPYGEALTRYLLRHPLSATLPRKFKIAFEGCPDDHASTAINDIGWRARVREVDGRSVRGFRVAIGGGTAIRCVTGHVLFDFLPASEMFNVTEAVLRVFHRMGDYQHKQRNRMKFLIKTLGWDGFRVEVERELEAFRAAGGAALPFDPEHPPVEQSLAGGGPRPDPGTIAERLASQTMSGPGVRPRINARLAVTSDAFLAWSKSNVRRQKQPGYALVTVTLPLGDMGSEQMRLVAELAAAFGDGAVRVTNDQNLVLRWVKLDDVQELYRCLAAAGLDRGEAGTLSDVTSCPGAESCRLAVTQSRGLGRLLTDELSLRPDLVAAVPGVDIKISGCPNGCGQHHIAGIGFQGSLRKVAGRPAPHYFVMLGGGIGDQAVFGRHVATIPARRGVEAVERLVSLFQHSHAPGEAASAFFRRVEAASVKGALAGLEIPVGAPDPMDFVDLEEQTEFRSEVMDGECSA